MMLGAANTERLLAQMRLKTGHPQIDAVIECVTTLCRDEIRALLAARDMALFRRNARNVLRDESLEVLSEVPVNLDRKIRAARG